MADAPPPSDAPCGKEILGMDPGRTAAALVTAIAVHSFVLMILSSRRRYSDNWALRYLRYGLSLVYLPFMSYVLSYLTTNLWSMDDDDQTWLLMSVVLVQFVKAKADLAALAVGATATPAASDDDINSLKIRPSTDSLIYSFWVAGLIVYNIFLHHCNKNGGDDDKFIILAMSPLWILGACRMVLRYVAFQWATRSLALGRNVQLIDGYMVQLQEEQLLPPASPVPCLIVTGESKQDVEKNPRGHRVRRSALDDPRSSMLVTLDRVWSQNDDPLLGQQRIRDLCLSFALFKCLRRRFTAGCRLTEAGSPWAFRFVHDGLLGPEDDHERIFRVIAGELAFAREFYYSHLPLASLGTLPAALYFLLSVLIFAYLCILLLFLLLFFLYNYLLHLQGYYTHTIIIQALVFVLAVVTACIEISEMVANVRSSWTKMSIAGHYIRCHNQCARRIFSCLLRRYKTQVHWKDEIGQIDLFVNKQSAPVIKVPPEAKASLLRTFRSSGRQLSAGTAAVQRRCQAFHQDITWACLGGELTTTTDVILVWCIATGLFKIKCSSASASSSLPSSKQTRRDVADSLSRYCAFLVAEAPDLLPDNAAWTKHRYKEVKKKIDPALLSWHSRGAPKDAGGFYRHLIGCFGSESSHELLRKGSRLGKLLVDEAAGTRGSGGEAGTRDGAEAEATVWELLAEFWSEMLLYVAPSDNVKAHIEVLQRSGELITLLWALLLHAGITSRPARHDPQV